MGGIKHPWYAPHPKINHDIWVWWPRGQRGNIMMPVFIHWSAYQATGEGGAASKSSAPVWPEETSEVPSLTQRRRHSSRHQQLNSESWIRGKSKWHQMTKHEKYTCSKLSWECGNDASNYVWCLCDEILLKVTKIKRRKGRINLLSEAGLCRYLPVYTLGCSFFFFFFASINLQDSNKHFRSRYCSFLRETVACDTVCQHGVTGICEEFGSLNDMRLDSGVCLHICTDASNAPAPA